MTEQADRPRLFPPVPDTFRQDLLGFCWLCLRVKDNNVPKTLYLIVSECLPRQRVEVSGTHTVQLGLQMCSFLELSRKI